MNGANSSMVSVITGRTVRVEANSDKTFDLVKWIRSRKLQWLGHILRMGPKRMLRQAIYEMYKTPQTGDMLMDVPETETWKELRAYARDRDYWRTRVRALRQPRVTTVTLGSHLEGDMTVPFTISS